MISLSDFDISIRDKMEEIRLKTDNETNAKTFCSCYIWAKPMNIKIHLEDNMYAIKNNSHGKTAWNFPVGEDAEKINFINKLLDIKKLKLLKLTHNDVSFLNENYPETFVFEDAVEDSEYIYDAVEHSELKGGKFSNLRRVVNRFNRQHNVRTVILEEDDISIAKSIMEIWDSAHQARGSLNTSGAEIDEFLLKHYDEIKIMGILIYVDNTPAAVVMGYPISSDMCDIAETKFIPDIKDIGYIAIEEFMKTFANTYRYFNFEEDMGITGLREHKNRLKPCRINRLYNAYLKGDKDER